MKFNTPYDREEKKYVDISKGETKTEQAYLRPEVQINRMVDAGVVYEAWKKTQVDFEDEYKDGDFEVNINARNPNYDYVDATNDFQQGVESIKNREKIARSVDKNIKRSDNKVKEKEEEKDDAKDGSKIDEE